MILPMKSLKISGALHLGRKQNCGRRLTTGNTEVSAYARAFLSTVTFG